MYYIIYYTPDRSGRVILSLANFILKIKYYIQSMVNLKYLYTHKNIKDEQFFSQYRERNYTTYTKYNNC